MFNAFRARAGGDAPRMNAAIRSVVRVATFYKLKVIGIERGYAGLIEGQVRPLGPRSVSGIINRGGTILKTARCVAVITMPETVTAAALSMALMVGGALKTVKTTPLLTWEDGIKAMEKAAYHPPSARSKLRVDHY